MADLPPGFTVDAPVSSGLPPGFQVDPVKPESSASTFIDAMGRAIGIPGKPNLNLEALSSYLASKIPGQPSAGALQAQGQAGSKAHPIASGVGSFAGHALEGAVAAAPVGAVAAPLLGAGKLAGAGVGALEGAAGGAASMPEHPGMGALAGGAIGAPVGGLLADSALSTLPGGFRTAEGRPVAKAVAGDTGRQALNVHAQNTADLLAANDAGLPPGTKLSYDTLNKANEAPNAVYNRFANALPDNMSLDDATLAKIQSAGQPQGGRITTGSPAVQSQLASISGDLQKGGFNGQQLVNEVRALRQEGSSGLASDDVDQQALGSAKLGIAGHLEDFAGSQLPPNSPVSLDQLQAARVALAKNYTVQSALKGSSVDMGAIARAQRQNPDLLTGGLKAIADFANENPALAGNAARQYSTPNVLNDLAGTAANSPKSVLSPDFWLGATGAKAAARRLLVGSADDLVPAANAVAPPRSKNAFAPTESPLTLSPASGTVSQAPQQPGLPFGPSGQPPFQQPSAAGLPSPAGPQSTIPLPGGEAPAAAQGSLPFGPPLGDDMTGTTPVASSTPEPLVHRGVEPGADPTVPRNSAGALFYSPDLSEAESSYGPITHTAQPHDVHDAGDITDLFKANGVDPKKAGDSASLMQALQSYRAKPNASPWLKFSYKDLDDAPAEYVHFPDLETNQPLGNQMTGAQ